MKRYLSLVLALALVFSCFTAVGAVEPELSVHQTTSKIFQGVFGPNATLTASSTTGVLNSEAGTYTWDALKRASFSPKQKPKLYIGRIYKFSLEASAEAVEGGDAIPSDFNHQVSISTIGKDDYVKFKSTATEGTTSKYTQFRWNGYSVTTEKKKFESHPHELIYIPSSLNNGIYDTFSKFEMWANAGKSVKYTLYGLDLEETISHYDTKFNIGSNGSVYITKYSDHDGKNLIEDRLLANGDIVAFEKQTKPGFLIVSEAGYVIDSVKYKGVEIEGASGKSSFNFNSDKITDVGSFDVTFKEGAETAANYDRISLSGNKTLYNNSPRDYSPIVVKAYDSEGNETDITGSAFLKYTTSNPLAFNLRRSLLGSGSVNGMSIVTATYSNANGKKVSASVIFQNAKDITAAPEKASAKVGVDSDGNNIYQNFSFKIDEPGHASESCLAWNADNAVVDSYKLRAYHGSNVDTATNGGYNWADGKYRLLGGWFYDDGTNANYLCLYLKNLRPDAREKNTAFSYYINIGKTSATDEKYSPCNKGDGVKATKGWHQAIAFIDNSGYVNVYIDGVLVYRLKMPVSDYATTTNDYASYLELRAVRGDTSKATFKFDEIYIADYPTVKPEYTASVVMAQNFRLTANGTVVKNGSNIPVKAGESITFETNAPGKIISTIERLDALGFNTETYTVNGSSYTVSNINDDAEYRVNYTEIEGISRVETQQVFYEDFKGTAKDGTESGYANVATTNRGRRLKIRDGVGIEYDAVNGYVTYAKASETEETPKPPHAYFCISNENNSKLFTYYLGRSYKYDFVVKGIGQSVYMQTVGDVNGEPWGANINPGFNSEDFANISSTLDVYSISDNGGNTWTAKSKDVTSLESITFYTSPRTFSEMTVTEYKYCLPVTLAKTGSGEVSFTEIDDLSYTMADGSNAVECGERTFTFTPAEGSKIESIEFDGNTIPVQDENGFSTVLNIDSPKRL
ncbi:MAG: hypothetical protein SPL89_08855, partial [Clostridia bacterium]|nr:hypothetical protein [Clostridia bacterium]